MENKERIRVCEICKKDILVPTMYYSTTKINGVYYKSGKCWFCNKCWKEMIPIEDIKI